VAFILINLIFKKLVEQHNNILEDIYCKYTLKSIDKHSLLIKKSIKVIKNAFELYREFEICK